MTAAASTGTGDGSGEGQDARELLLSDIANVLDEHLPLFQRALANTDGELPAAITIAIKWKPEKRNAEGDITEAAHIEVSGKASLPSNVLPRAVDVLSLRGRQLVLFGPTRS